MMNSKVCFIYPGFLPRWRVEVPTWKVTNHLILRAAGLLQTPLLQQLHPSPLSMYDLDLIWFPPLLSGDLAAFIKKIVMILTFWHWHYDIEINDILKTVPFWIILKGVYSFFINFKILKTIFLSCLVPTCEICL